MNKSTKVVGTKPGNQSQPNTTAKPKQNDLYEYLVNHELRLTCGG